MPVELMLTLDFIRLAEARIRPFVHRTPVVTSRPFDGLAGRRVFFKCENFQRAGAFKMRGATNKILSLSDEERARGVVAFSSRNHAQALALAARDASARAVIVMPADAPRTKLAATKGYGAEVVPYDRQREDRETVARRLSEREGLAVVSPFDDYHVIAGQGTRALEPLEEGPPPDHAPLPGGAGAVGRPAPPLPKGRARAPRPPRHNRRRHAHADARRA